MKQLVGGLKNVMEGVLFLRERERERESIGTEGKVCMATD
jgi:hypothetical protein